jgi:hypothetical protein
MLAYSASAIAAKSSAKASGWPWKFPPLTMSPFSNTSGLSVTPFISVSITPFAYASASRLAPCTCGTHRRQYGSCTFPQFRCDSRISLSSSSLRTFAATTPCPGCGRMAWMRASNGRMLPCSASSDMAAARSNNSTSRVHFSSTNAP